jgi:hypothetical protein
MTKGEAIRYKEFIINSSQFMIFFHIKDCWVTNWQGTENYHLDIHSLNISSLKDFYFKLEDYIGDYALCYLSAKPG